VLDKSNQNCQKKPTNILQSKNNHKLLLNLAYAQKKRLKTEKTAKLIGTKRVKQMRQTM